VGSNGYSGMEDSDGEIDWLNMSAAERIEPIKALFVAMRKVSITTGRHIDLLLDDALGEAQSRGTDYESNFRKGKIAAMKAMMIHQWLEYNHFEEAKNATKNIQTNLFQINPKSAWDSFVEDRAITGKLGAIPLTKQMGIAQRSKEVRKSVTTIRLGQDYCFELDSGLDGHCVAFEGYQGQWHPLPLGADTRRLRLEVQQGVQRLPRDAKGNPIALVELDDGGEHQIVVVVATDKAMPTDRREILKLDARAISFEVHRVSVTFVT
jgi:hypothetical protein